MRTNVDHIAEYLKLRPTISSLTLFNTFYGMSDSKWLHDKWQRRELLPQRLNTWAEEACKEIRLARAGIKAVINNPQEARS